jgi:hypothetical protein
MNSISLSCKDFKAEKFRNWHPEKNFETYQVRKNIAKYYKKEINEMLVNVSQKKTKRQSFFTKLTQAKKSRIEIEEPILQKRKMKL